MAKRIPRDFIQSLLERVDIIDVITARVPMKKKGLNYSGCCPFHNEKTPSFSANQSKQFYYCFGCGKHGNAISFLIDHDNLAFPEAVEELAHSVGLDIPYEMTADQAQTDDLQPLYQVAEKSNFFFQKQLREHAQKGEAIEYLKQRGLSGKTAKIFSVGYAPEGWDNLSKQFPAQSQSDLLKAGLLIKNEKGRVYDRFRHRIMFPIRDRRGRVVGFGGRVMGKDETPKYLNSPETPIFHKGRTLYGLYEARQNVQKFDQLLLVEGYMDVIVLHEHGIHFALATLGTATTQDHLKEMFRLCKKVTFCYDGDNAGRQAAVRALDNALPLINDEQQIRFLFLPQGEDPDSLVQQEGKEAFLQRINKAVPLSEFLLAQAQINCDLSQLEGRAQLVNQALPMLQKLPDSNFRTLLVNKLAETAQLDRLKIARQLGIDNMAPQTHIIPQSERKHGLKTPLERILAYCLQFPQKAKDLPLKTLTENSQDKILYNQVIDFIKKHPNMTVGALFEYFKSDVNAVRIAALASADFDLDGEALEQEMTDIIKKFSRETDEKQLQNLTDKSKLHALSDEEKQTLRQLLYKNRNRN